MYQRRIEANQAANTNDGQLCDVASYPTFGNHEQFSDFSNAEQGAIWRLLHIRGALRSTTIGNL